MMAVTVSPLERRRLRVRGLVQGVGFRPFVHRLARRHGIAGFVLNDGEGVIVEAEAAAGILDRFIVALREEAPPSARVDALTATRMDVRGEPGFWVAPSARGPATALVAPDLATCPDCLRELFDPGDRRHGYAFINCTQCGPRFTIVRALPYDRATTTMAGFSMCEACRREYEDPGDRRFHAEPIACPACGPQTSMPVDEAVRAVLDGLIVAVKGLGGYHLACDATDDAAVERLRARKHRDEKPLAVMSAEPSELGIVTDDERALLESPVRPIVLVRRREDAPLAAAVAP